MRTEKEMMDLLVGAAKKDERIRLVMLEGSRTNPAIPDDAFKDYDVSYFVTDMESFTRSDEWLEVFGKRIILQKPDAMSLYPPEPGNWFSYLMLLEDGNKVDLTLIPLEKLNEYLEKSDGLIQVMLDKDSRVKQPLEPTDKHYWIQPPTAQTYDDCCNEFWWVSTYVTKGLARGEFLFAADHLQTIVRPTLLQMMAWEIGSREGFNFSLGKNYKFIHHHLPDEEWNRLLTTFRNDGIDHMWESLFACHELFRSYAQKVADAFDYDYSAYDKKVSDYIDKLYNQYGRTERRK